MGFHQTQGRERGGGGAGGGAADRGQPPGAQGARAARRSTPGERRILIDFSRTGYIDSSGWAPWSPSPSGSAKAGGELRLSGLNEDLRSLFELTKLDTLFAIAETPQQALASF